MPGTLRSRPSAAASSPELVGGANVERRAIFDRTLRPKSEIAAQTNEIGCRRDLALQLRELGD